MQNQTHPMHSWLMLNHPEHINNVMTPEVSDLMMSFAAATSDPVYAPSQASLTGPGAGDAQSNSDWASNPALGAANLANMARTAAKYNPTDLSNSGATNAQYQDFVKRLISCPLFIVKLSDHTTINRESSDWNTLIDAIANTFTGIMDKDKNKVVDGLKNLAQAASSKASTKQTQAVFVQNVINVDGVISYYLYSTRTTFEETKGKGYDTKQSSFDVVQLRLQFQSDLWPDWWQKVKNAFDGTVDDWLNDNKTSTKGTDSIPALS